MPESWQNITLTCRDCILNYLMKLYRKAGTAKMFRKNSSVVHHLSNSYINK